MPNQPTFGEWLKQQLRIREMNQSDLAHRIHVGTGTVSRWIHGQRPDPYYCELLADVFGKTSVEVMTLAGHIPREEADDDPERAALIHMLRTVSLREPSRRSTLRSILEAWRRDDDMRAAASTAAPAPHPRPPLPATARPRKRL